MSKRRRDVTWCVECRAGRRCPLAGTRFACRPLDKGGTWSFQNDKPEESPKKPTPKGERP
jgi:hypothetical protein